MRSLASEVEVVERGTQFVHRRTRTTGEVACGGEIGLARSGVRVGVACVDRKNLLGKPCRDQPVTTVDRRDCAIQHLVNRRFAVAHVNMVSPLAPAVARIRR